MTRDELIGALVSLKPALEAEGVRHIALFGSRVRGDHSSQSDIDLLLDVGPNRKFSILNLVGVEHLIADTTGLTANAFMRRSLDQNFQSSIRTDVLEIF